MSDFIKSLLDKRAKAWSEAQDIRHRAEREENRDLTNEEDQTFTRALDEVERLDGQIRNAERAQRLEDVQNDAEQRNRSSRPTNVEDTPAEDRGEQYRGAFEAYMRRGAADLTGEQRQALQAGFDSELRAQGVGGDAAGGYTVPEGFRNTMTETMKAYGGLLSLVNVITTDTGNKLVWPTSDETAAKGAILAENTQISEQDVAFGTKNLDAYMYTSKLVRVSYQLLQDSAFNLNAWLPAKLGERIGRAVAEHVAVGTGTDEPEGIVNLAAGATGATSASAKVTYDNLIDLEHSVDPAYRGRAQYAFNDQALKLVRKLKDTQDRPLWVPSVIQGAPSTFNGHAYTIDNDLPVPAPGAKSIFFGDFNAAYTARQVSGSQLMRLTERYADFLQVGFFGFQRFDGVIDDAAAAKAYQHGAAA